MRGIKHFVISYLYILLLWSIFMYGCGQKKSEMELSKVHKITWLYDIEQAFLATREQNRPLIVDFMATWCPPCQKMEDSTFSDPNVIQKVRDFVPVRIDVDKQKEVANMYGANALKYGGIGIPNVLFMDKDKKKLKHIVGYRGPKAFISVIDSVLNMLGNENAL